MITLLQQQQKVVGRLLVTTCLRVTRKLGRAKRAILSVPVMKATLAGHTKKIWRNSQAIDRTVNSKFPRYIAGTPPETSNRTTLVCKLAIKFDGDNNIRIIRSFASSMRPTDRKVKRSNRASAPSKHQPVVLMSSGGSFCQRPVIVMKSRAVFLQFLALGALQKKSISGLTPHCWSRLEVCVPILPLCSVSDAPALAGVRGASSNSQRTRSPTIRFILSSVCRDLVTGGPI